jgi:murein DD-endopeptidase MepM/ murein hydrolase activator NlpD
MDPVMNYGFYRIIILVCLVAGGLAPCAAASGPEDDVSSLPAINRFYSPFMEQGRNSFPAVARRTFSRFGSYRTSSVKGHLHSGIDLQGKMAEQVYAIAPGRVAAVYWSFPNRAVAVFHRMPDGSPIYSAYVHIEDITVKPGDVVNENTPLGRIFNRAEMKRSRFPTPHLHLEIRRSMKDEGERSYTAMTMKALKEYCLDPFAFLERRMPRPQSPLP